MENEKWDSEVEAVKLLAVEDIPDIAPAVFAKHLNLAFEKGKQIGSGQAESKLDQMSAELQSLKFRLPINRDGDMVLWGCDQYYILTNGDPCRITIRAIDIDSKGNFTVTDGWRVLIIKNELFSSAESCRTAATTETI
jgi:hypothetical protein